MMKCADGSLLLVRKVEAKGRRWIVLRSGGIGSSGRHAERKGVKAYEVELVGEDELEDV
jgi:hypothetical protein